MYFPFVTAKNLAGFGAEHGALMRQLDRLQMILVLALDAARAEQDQLDELIVREKMLPGRVSITSAHLMGGCRMGEDADRSVCDSWGRVHGTDWLYVADASLFPGCAEITPYVTSMALADRVAEGISKRRMA